MPLLTTALLQEQSILPTLLSFLEPNQWMNSIFLLSPKIYSQFHNSSNSTTHQSSTSESKILEEPIWKELCLNHYSSIIASCPQLIVNEKGYKKLFIQQWQNFNRFRKGLYHLTCLEGHLATVSSLGYSNINKANLSVSIPTLLSGDMHSCMCQWDLRSTLQMKTIDFHGGDEGKILKISDHVPKQIVASEVSDVVLSVSPYSDQCEMKHLSISCSSGNESDGSHSSLVVFDPSDAVVKYSIKSGLNQTKSLQESKILDFEHFGIEFIVNSTFNCLNIWKLVDGKYERIHQIESTETFHNHSILKIIKLQDPTLKLVATSGLDSFICISNIETGEVITRISTLHSSPINTSMKIFKSGNSICILTTDMSGSIVLSHCKQESIQDATQWRQIILDQSSSNKVKLTSDMYQSSLSEFVFSTSFQDRSLQVFSVHLTFIESGDYVVKLSNIHEEKLSSTASFMIISSNKLICSCRDCTVKMFSIEKTKGSITLNLVSEIDCSGSQCISMLLLPDQSILLLGLSDSAIYYVKFSPRYEWEYPSNYELGKDDMMYDNTNHAYLKPPFKDFSIDHAKVCEYRKPIKCVPFLEGIFDDKLIGLKCTKNTSYLIHNLFTEEECQHLIEKTEQLSYEDCYGYAKEYRSNKRVIVEDKISAQIAFERAKDMVPNVYIDENGDVWDLACLNSRWRFCRYTPGQHFLAPHYDGHYEMDKDTRSFYTFMFYLNGGYEDGRTTFIKSHTFPPQPPFDIMGQVEPESGLCIVFPHNILHYGSVLKSGTKYLMRSELIYKRRLN